MIDGLIIKPDSIMRKGINDSKDVKEKQDEFQLNLL